LGFSLPVLACFGLILSSAAGLQLLSLGAPAGVPSVSGPAFGPAVAIIRVQGLIVTQADPFDYSAVASSAEIVDLIGQAGRDPDVRAVVLAVNSPGGSVVASDEIHHALEQLNKPVVASMGELAASGGYYVSAGSDWIVANPNTLTGSIGVISEFPNAAGLLEKIGVDFVVITSGPRKDFGSPYRPMSAAERRYWQQTVDEIYAGFVRLVAEGRGIPEDEIRDLADGSVYTGRQALDLGLVDALGYEEDAIAKAAELGGISGEPRVIEYAPTPGFFGLLSSALSRGTLPSLAQVLTWFGHPSVAVRWTGP
jgi:protease-4